MATYSEVYLSGSDNKFTPITMNQTTVIAIHTAPASTTVFDEVTLWVINPASIQRTITFILAGVTLATITLSPSSPARLVFCGQVMSNGATLTARCDASAGTQPVVIGRINRRTE